MKDEFTDKNVIIFGLVFDSKHDIVPMGSLYDSLEYFMKIYENNNDIRLLFYIIPTGGLFDQVMFRKKQHGVKPVDYVDFKVSHINIDLIKKQLLNIIDGKYIIDDYFFMDNIHLITLTKFFIRNNPNKILTIDLSTPRKFKLFLARAKTEILIIPEWTDPVEYFYQSEVNKVTYYTEMPFCHCDVPYRMKFDFERYKPLDDDIPEKIYINYPKMTYPYDNERVNTVISNFGKEVLIKEDQFLYDLHNHFYEYVYFQSDKWFDPHPKLFHECKYYNKPYYYYNWKHVKDGSYYRYRSSLTDNLSDLQLTKDDIIVKRMCD